MEASECIIDMPHRKCVSQCMYRKCQMSSVKDVRRILQLPAAWECSVLLRVLKSLCTLAAGTKTVFFLASCLFNTYNFTFLLGEIGANRDSVKIKCA